MIDSENENTLVCWINGLHKVTLERDPETRRWELTPKQLFSSISERQVGFTPCVLHSKAESH